MSPTERSLCLSMAKEIVMDNFKLTVQNMQNKSDLVDKFQEDLDNVIPNELITENAIALLEIEVQKYDREVDKDWLRDLKEYLTVC